jgi:hypothetical protein
MPSLLVAYDLVGTDATSENYEKLIARIKEYPWARVELSTWIVKTDAKAKAVRDDLRAYMHASDRLFVAVLTGEAAWHNVRCKDQWLKDNL